MHAPRRQAMMDRQIEPCARSLRHWITAGTLIFTAASSWGQILFFVAIGLMLFVLPGYQAGPRPVCSATSVTLIMMMMPLEVLLSSAPGCRTPWWRCRRSTSSASRWKARRGAGVRPRGAARRLAAARGEGDRATPTAARPRARPSLLGPIDLTFEPGELVFLVGGNGSGKTTLAKLLIGLYPPEAGRSASTAIAVDRRATATPTASTSRPSSPTSTCSRTCSGSTPPELDAEARALPARALQLDRKVQDRGGRALDDRPVAGAAQAPGPAHRLPRGPADLPVRRMGRGPGSDVQGGLLPRRSCRSSRRAARRSLVISHDDHYYDVADRIVKLDYGRVEYDHRRAAA